MKITSEKLAKSKVKLTVEASEQMLAEVKREVLRDLRPKVKAPGFRAGHAPDKVVEQQLSQQYVQNEVLDKAVNRAYVLGVSDQKLKTLGSPEVKLTKFVAYSELTIEAVVEVVPDFKMPDYKSFKVKSAQPRIEPSEVDEVLQNLQTRMADYKEVGRAAREGDRAWIDFKGVRADDGAAVSGASGKDYPLILGSNTFIKEFEPNIVGLKPGEEKKFTVTFPKDYRVASLQNSKVAFTVTLKKVEEIIKPKLDAALAAQAGPFKSLSELKADVEKQLLGEKAQQETNRQREELVGTLVEKSNFDVPEDFLKKVKEELRKEFVQNLQYRNMTLANYLEQEGINEEEFEKKELAEKATKRAKASIILTEVAEQEELTVTGEELKNRIEQLKQRYTDPKFQTELQKLESQREIAAQILTEKTISKLLENSKT